MANKTMKTNVPLDDGSSAFKLHLANIMCLQYGPISCLSLNSSNTKLALFRGGDAPAIEIWDVSCIPFLQRVLYDLETINEKVSVESLAWVNDRLFSCGLHGFVVEHCLVSRKMKKKYMATSGPVWSLSVSPDKTLLGAATEDGFINIFQVTEDELLFQKVLDRQEGRILCLCWSPCGKYIATGSVDNVRLWDVERGHAIQRLSTGRSKKNETIVWTVLIIDELTIVSGDSRGVVSFWDGKIGVLKFKIFTHRADILRLSASPDRSMIYVSGVDPNVILLSQIGKTGEKWVKSHQRNMHTNDVMCLETMGNQLISAGVDCELTISTPPMRGMPRSVRKFPPIPKGPRIFVSNKSKRILVQEDRGINVWELPGKSEELVKLIEFKSRGNQIINSSCMNPSGQVFVYSTKEKIHFFRLVTCADGRIIPVKLKKTISQSPATLKRDDLFDPDDMLWTLNFLNETRLLAISLDGSLAHIFQIDEHSDTFSFKSAIPLEDYIKPVGINLVATRPNGNLVAVATSDDTINLLEISDESTITDCFTVPRHHCPITSLEFHAEHPYLLITYADHTVRIFNFLSYDIVFHEEIGGPRRKGRAKIKKAIKKGSRQEYEKQEDEDSVDDEETPENEECHHSILGTTWSLDGTKVIFHEINKMHLMEFTQLPPTGFIKSEVRDEPILKRPKRESISANKEKKGRGKYSRSPSSSPVPHMAKAEEWISNKLYNMKLNKLAKRRRGTVPDSTYDAFIDWKVLNCEKTYKYVAHVSFLEDSKELLVVEVKPSSLLSKLPPAFARKRFGM